MELTESKQGEYTVVELNGSIDTATAKPFEEKLVGLIQGGNIRLVIDCSQLRYVNSTGLRAFLFAAKEITRLQGRLGLVGVPPLIYDVFEMAGFDEIFQFFETQEDATESLGGT